jgi:hypothetical protein
VAQRAFESYCFGVSCWQATVPTDLVGQVAVGRACEGQERLNVLRKPDYPGLQRRGQPVRQAAGCGRRRLALGAVTEGHVPTN